MKTLPLDKKRMVDYNIKKYKRSVSIGNQNCRRGAHGIGWMAIGSMLKINANIYKKVISEFLYMPY
jgi:hypothetical protein